MLTWTQLQNKAVRLSRDTTPGTLVQLQEDMNTGYQMFNAKLSRYFSRKQQFADIVSGQSIYQTPVDCVRVIGMTLNVGNSTYKQVLKEVRSESEWRTIKAYPYNNNWPVAYFMIGNDELEIWPTPSQSVTNGIRFYYQVQDSELSVEDIVSTALSPTQTCTVTNGDVTVTSTGSTFTNQMVGLWFQTTGVTNLQWYEIVGVPTSSTLQLKSGFVGNSSSGLNFKIGQMPILPGEYHDAICDYALGLFFSSKGNEARAAFHLGDDVDGKRGRYWSMVQDAIAEYSSSSEGNVITDDNNYINSWLITPLPGTP